MKDYIEIVKKRLKEMPTDEDRMNYLRGAGKVHDVYHSPRHAGKAEVQKFLRREWNKLMKRRKS